jgi:uncharacterized protein
MTIRQSNNDVPWARVREHLYGTGFASLGTLLDSTTCQTITSWYDNSELFRSRIEMGRYRFGQGEYKYFAYPLPDVVSELRESLYSSLAPIASDWMRHLGQPKEFPAELRAFIRTCHLHGQKRPTPILLRYGCGDFNCLHQDLYGDLVFPLQLTVLLSAPEDDFTGGEFLLVEQRPRAQSKGEVVPLRQAEAVIFPVHHRPVEGSRGAYRVTMRHGVSRLRSGRRLTLGIIFHDAA